MNGTPNECIGTCANTVCEKKHIPNTKPTFHMKCNNCEAEFDILSSYAELDKELCPECGSNDVKDIFVSYPLDGPGFQEGYSTEKLSVCGMEDINNELCLLTDR
ncbi:zinc ribbon domain-containing protein [Adlercreutzia sp. ZJ304]|uniref:FmdB family zinc ribbon protein n=1 Tax=Adlercreutzia sp. ZJ304 TaxID=2709791 RepID=UPI0013ED2AFA|nr:zinc ribbon domain-containing protein [Adlercreutzia sp. ZJ304]